MKVRMHLVLPVLCVLGGCTAGDPAMTGDTGPAASASAAAPAQVDAASAALGQKLDNMIARQRGTPVTVTR